MHQRRQEHDQCKVSDTPRMEYIPHDYDQDEAYDTLAGVFGHDHKGRAGKGYKGEEGHGMAHSGHKIHHLLGMYGLALGVLRAKHIIEVREHIRYGDEHSQCTQYYIIPLAGREVLALVQPRYLGEVM